MLLNTTPNLKIKGTKFHNLNHDQNEEKNCVDVTYTDQHQRWDGVNKMLPVSLFLFLVEVFRSTQATTMLAVPTNKPAESHRYPVAETRFVTFYSLLLLQCFCGCRWHSFLSFLFQLLNCFSNACCVFHWTAMESILAMTAFSRWCMRFSIELGSLQNRTTIMRGLFRKLPKQ